MTDQERHHVHWPKGWAEKNLPGLQRLKRHGLYFNRAYTAVTQCSPSRALMMQTGRFAPVNRVTQTLLWPGLVHQEPPASLAAQGKSRVRVVWKGKWHLSWADNAARQRRRGLHGGRYRGWSRWNPPDAGNSLLE